MNTTVMNHRAEDLRNLVCLAAGTTWRRERKEAPVRIRAIDGAIWITEEGDGEDYLLERGDAIELAGAGLVVVEALTPVATAEVEEKG
jgi:hypothetical protein